MNNTPEKISTYRKRWEGRTDKMYEGRWSKTEQNVKERPIRQLDVYFETIIGIKSPNL